MPNFVTTEQLLQQVAEVMRDRMPKRLAELQGAPNQLPIEYPKAWVLFEFDLGGESNKGDLPRGVVDFDSRASERREQDTGETATVDGMCTIYFAAGSLTGDELKRRAVRYGDAMLYTLLREAKAKRPKDGTVLPGLFRVWPTTMAVGVIEESADRWGAQVKWRATIDTSDAYAA